jgi:hypothetical protein
MELHDTVLYKVLSKIPGFFMYVYNGDRQLFPNIPDDKIRVMPNTRDIIDKNIIYVGIYGTTWNDINFINNFTFSFFQICESKYYDFRYYDNINGGSWRHYEGCVNTCKINRMKMLHSYYTSMNDTEIIASGNMKHILQIIFGDQDGTIICDNAIHKYIVSLAADKCAIKIFLFKDVIERDVLYHINTALLSIEGFNEIVLKN